MSAANVDVQDLSSAEANFVLAAATTEALSIGANEAGELVVSCHNHDDRATVSMAAVFALASRHNLRVVDGEAHWDGETVDLVVVGDGEWHGGEDGDEA